MKNTLLALVAGVALMACSPASEPTPAAPVEPAAAPAPEPAPPIPPATDPATADACNMERYMVLIGKPVTDPRMPPSGASVRIIKPGQVTMDFSATRLNFGVDASGAITGIRCI